MMTDRKKRIIEPRDASKVSEYKEKSSQIIITTIKAIWRAAIAKDCLFLVVSAVKVPQYLIKANNITGGMSKF